MSVSGSVSAWIRDTKRGCQTAARNLWTRYHVRLVGLARRQLVGNPRAISDEDDVAITAFESFLHRCRNGGYPEVKNRLELWRLLATITRRKVHNQLRRDKRRTDLGFRCEVKFGETGAPSDSQGDDRAGAEPSPEVLATLSDAFFHLLSVLGDGEMRSMVIYRLEGYSNEEIAARLGRSLPTIERRMRLVRELWQQEMAE